MRLAVLVQPRSSKDEVVGWQGQALKVRLAAPPVDGEANAALIDFLAKAWGLKKAQVTIAAGLSSRRKTLEISGITETDVKRLLA